MYFVILLIFSPIPEALREKRKQGKEAIQTKMVALPMPEFSDFRNDPVEEMTLARRFALKWLYKKKWYRWFAKGAIDEIEETQSHSNLFEASSRNSGVADHDDDKPSLARAWAYFEHVALDRYIVGEEERQREQEISKSGLKRFYKRIFAGERELKRAPPGTRGVKTRLFDPFNTPHSQVRSPFPFLAAICADASA